VTGPDPGGRPVLGPDRGGPAALRGRRGRPLPGPVVVRDGEEWVRTAADRIADALRHAVASGTRPSLALSGGSTPRPVYARLATLSDLPWSEVEFFFGDERCVPPGSPDSNYAMAREMLLGPLGLDARVHRMEADRPDRRAAADDYAALLPPHLTVLLLGLGREGHTASLFPGSWALGERSRKVVPVSVPATPPERLTITPLVIEEAVHLFVLARGEEKADAAARALEAPWAPEVCPAQLARRGTWLLDPAAAAHLSRPGGEGQGEARRPATGG